MSEKLDHRNSFFRICVDSGENGLASGRVFSRRLTEPMSFPDLASLLLQLDKCMEMQNFPQGFQRMRSFTGGKEADKRGLLPEGAMSGETVSAAWGKRATFLLHVLTRQNASWQGKVDWLDGGEEAPFSSELELVKLAEERLFR